MKIQRIGFLLTIMSMITVASAKDFYVSLQGKDSNNGTRQAPFATLQRAQKAIRDLNMRKEAINVYLYPGNYRIDRTLVFSEEDSGTDKYPITYRSLTGKRDVVLYGSRTVPVTKISKITDESVRKRIAPELVDKLLEIDLSDMNLKHIARFPDVFNDNGNIITLFANNKRLPISRYPNQGYMEMKHVLINGGGEEDGANWRDFYDNDGPVRRAPRQGIFQYRDLRHSHWVDAARRGEVWLKGYWRVPWQNEAIRVDKIDTTLQMVVFSQPISGGIGNKYMRPQGSGKEKYWLLNLLEEVDIPGEWCLDFAARKIYLYPPSNDGQLTLSIADNSSPIIEAKHASHIRFLNLCFEETQRNAVEINEGKNILIAGCRVRNTTKTAIIINGGKNHTVQSCDLYELGGGGVWLKGGDENSTPRVAAGHRVVNNHIFEFSQIEKIYCAAINCGFTGGGGGGHHTAVGMYIANNLIHGTPHVGVLFGSFDNIFEYNEIFDVCRVSNDMGGFYSFDDNKRMGNLIFRYNFIHSSPNADGIYFDEDHREMQVYANIVALNSSSERGTAYLYKKGHQYQQPYTINCYNNIAINSNVGFEIVTGDGSTVNNNFTVNVKKPYNYSRVVSGKRYPVRATKELVSGHNVSYDKDPGFVDMENFDFRLKKNSVVFKDLPGFKPVPFQKIGLYKDEYRKKTPSQEEMKRWRTGTKQLNMGYSILDR